MLEWHFGRFFWVNLAPVGFATRDIMMGDTISSDASAMDVDSHGQPDDDGSGQPATLSPMQLLSQPQRKLIFISTENIAWS